MGARGAPRNALAMSDPFPSTLFTRRLERRVLGFISAQGIARPGEKAVVAVSGGPDSTALLVLASRLAPVLGWRLTVAHFDHGLRGPAEAAADEAFVRDVASALGLPVTTGKGDVIRSARRNGLSLEDAARRLRYRFLARAARAAGATAVLLGHTRDDQAETVLLHILRGSGLDGLAGMRPRSAWPVSAGPEAVRPLLGVARWETERYCRELGLAPRQDATNEMLLAYRNRIRHEVMPRLRQINPQAAVALARMADAVAVDAAHLKAEADAAWRRLAQREGGAVSLPASGLEKLDPAIGARVLRRAFETLAKGRGSLGNAHVQSLLTMLEKGRGRVSLPCGITASMTAKGLILGKSAEAGSKKLAETVVDVPGVTVVGPWQVEAAIVAPPADVRSVGALEAYMDAGALAPPLTVRSRRPGDRLRPLGLGGEKKVQDILVDARVPAEERDGVPLLCDARGVVWVVGHRLDQRAAVTAETQKAVRLTFRPRGAPAGWGA